MAVTAEADRWSVRTGSVSSTHQPVEPFGLSPFSQGGNRTAAGRADEDGCCSPPDRARSSRAVQRAAKSSRSVHRQDVVLLHRAAELAVGTTRRRRRRWPHLVTTFIRSLPPVLEQLFARLPTALRSWSIHERRQVAFRICRRTALPCARRPSRGRGRRRRVEAVSHARFSVAEVRDHEATQRGSHGGHQGSRHH